MDTKIQRLLGAIAYEGFDYALTAYSSWEELKDDYPELYKKIQLYIEVHDDLVNDVEALENEYREKGWYAD